MMNAPATIFALSSGQPPAGLAVVRISGPAASQALLRLAGRVPPPRRASLAPLKGEEGNLLDWALILRFPGPGTVTGEDVAELHLHGGRAVVAAVLGELERLPGFRPAEAGEFTRRALENGRVDLAEAEGLADLLEAETEAQRRAALLLAGGALRGVVQGWSRRLLALAAAVEARLDFGDEGDVTAEMPPEWEEDRAGLAFDMAEWLARPAAERLKDGIRIVIAGPPNAGKSTLLNALVGRAAAITSATPGTTRDLIEVPVAIGGVPFLLIDSAGLRSADDEIEAIGVARAEGAIAGADLVLWLGAPGAAPRHQGLIQVHAKSDLDPLTTDDRLPVSAMTGAGMTALATALLERARNLLPIEGEVALNRRHRACLARVSEHLAAAGAQTDDLLIAEELRQARRALDELTGQDGVEAMLDALFSRFCIGK